MEIEVLVDRLRIDLRIHQRVALMASAEVEKTVPHRLACTRGNASHAVDRQIHATVARRQLREERAAQCYAKQAFALTAEQSASAAAGSHRSQLGQFLIGKANPASSAMSARLGRKDAHAAEGNCSVRPRRERVMSGPAAATIPGQRFVCRRAAGARKPHKAVMLPISPLISCPRATPILVLRAGRAMSADSPLRSSNGCVRIRHEASADFGRGGSMLLRRSKADGRTLA